MYVATCVSAECLCILARVLKSFAKCRLLATCTYGCLPALVWACSQSVCIDTMSCTSFRNLKIQECETLRSKNHISDSYNTHSCTVASNLKKKDRWPATRTWGIGSITARLARRALAAWTTRIDRSESSPRENILRARESGRSRVYVQARACVLAAVACWRQLCMIYAVRWCGIKLLVYIIIQLLMYTHKVRCVKLLSMLCANTVAKEKLKRPQHTVS